MKLAALTLVAAAAAAAAGCRKTVEWSVARNEYCDAIVDVQKYTHARLASIDQAIGAVWTETICHQYVDEEIHALGSYLAGWKAGALALVRLRPDDEFERWGLSGKLEFDSSSLSLQAFTACGRDLAVVQRELAALGAARDAAVDSALASCRAAGWSSH